MFSLSSHPLKRELLIKSVAANAAGALVVFEGWVRDHNEGKKVCSLEYEVYEELAQKEGRKILDEARDKFNLHEIICAHRVGHLTIGESAVIVAATASHRDDAFKATRYVIDEIKMRLPIWKKEHYLEQKAEWVSCRDHKSHVHFHEADYYAKQAKLVSQSALTKARVLVVGAGGLGCPVLTALAMAGVGFLDLIDFDRVALANLHRQPLYSTDSVGEKKAVIASSRLRSLNPFIQIQGHVEKLGPENIERFISGKDLVADCTDNLETKFLLHDACRKLGIPLISASMHQFEGQIRTFDPKLAIGCLRCTLPLTPDDSLLGNCNDFGVLGASVATIGSLQASEALLFLLHGTNNTLYETLFFDLHGLTQMRVKNLKREGCPACVGDIDLLSDGVELDYKELSGDFELIDIRDRADSYLDHWTESQKKIVVYCHRGVRSKRLVKQLRARGFTHYYSLSGGACSL